MPVTEPTVYRLPTLDPKVIKVIHQRYPDFKGRDYDAHWQVSFVGRGYGDVVRINGSWRTLIYRPGGSYLCTGGVHKKHRDAIAAVKDLLIRTEAIA